MSHTTSLKPRLLVITTSGGGGHLQAANAKILEERAKNPLVDIHVHDVLENASGRWFGKVMINNIWNATQRKGFVRSLELWVGSSPLFDILFWIPVFLQIFYKLIKYDIDHVIDTQPLCLPSIVQAVKLYCFLKKKTVYIEKILTELPTNYASYCLNPIKRLHPKNRTRILLKTIFPLLVKEETAEHFWKDQCGLHQNRIVYGDLPIRPSFKKYQHVPLVHEPFSLSIHLKTPQERELLQKILSQGSSALKMHFHDTSLDLTLPKDAHITTLMLGSQPVQDATFAYVTKIIKSIQCLSSAKDFYLFVFCSGSQASKSPPLQERIYALINKNHSDLSFKNITIIPMSAQDDAVIAPLYFRSNVTITKSGGITAMELMSVAKGKILIHHENRQSFLDRLLLKTPLGKLCSGQGMPKWEYGNAVYLQKIKGATMVTPETLSETVFSA